MHRGRRKGVATTNNQVLYGEFGIKSLEPAWVTARQIEAARVAIGRSLRRGGKMWVRVFPDKPFTKKPAETRMGGGKGNVEAWVAVVKPGRVLFEVGGVPREEAMTSLRLATYKLPIATKIVSRNRFELVETAAVKEE
jgi:large subunit ribosomal protein L16